MKPLRLYEKLNNRPVQVIFDQGIYSGSNFLITVGLARLLGPEGFGYFTSVILYVYLLTSVVSAFIIQPFQVAGTNLKESKAYNSFIIFSELIMVAIILLLTFLILHINVSFVDFLKPISGSVLLFVFGFLFHDFFRKYFLAKDNLKFVIILDMVLMVNQVIALVLLYVVKNTDLGYIFQVLGATFIVAFMVAINYLKPKIHKISEWYGFVQMHLKQGVWLFFTALIQWWSNNLFVVASGVFLGASALGAFRLVQSMFGVLNILLQAVENYVLPQATEKLSHSVDESKYYIKNLGKKGILIFGAVLLILFFFSKPVITLFGGAEYAEYSFVVKGMSVLYFVIYIGYANRLAIRMLLLNRHFFIGYLMTFVTSLLLLNYLLGTWGLWGAIAGLILNQLIMFTYWYYVLAKNKFLLWR